MLDAVLFDWSHTLVQSEWDDALVEAGHRAALGRDDAEFTARWRELILGDAHDRRPYAELLSELGIDDPDAFIDAEHGVWFSAYRVQASAVALLEMLRDRGLKTGVVGGGWPDPERILRADAEALGLAAHFDVIVFGPDSLVRACSELEVDPAHVLLVSDSLGDVQRGAALGMTTAQALWFRADDTPGIEADFQVFTAVDVVSIVRRLARSTA